MDRPSLVQAEDRRMAESLPFKRAVPSGVIEEAYKSEAHRCHLLFPAVVFCCFLYSVYSGVCD